MAPSSHDGTHVGGNASPDAFEGFNLTDETPTYGGANKQPQAQQPMSSTGQPAAVLKVQPLSKDVLQPSYAQDLGTGSIGASAGSQLARPPILPLTARCPSPPDALLPATDHGVYGSFISGLGSCLGVLGAVSPPPAPPLLPKPARPDRCCFALSSPPPFCLR